MPNATYLESDETSSSLEKLSLFFERTSAKTPLSVLQQCEYLGFDVLAETQRAFDAGGVVLAKAHALYWSWSHVIMTQDSLSCFGVGWEKQYKDRYKPSNPFEKVVIANESQNRWSISIDPITKEPSIWDGEWIIYPDETLEQLLVSLLLSNWLVRDECQVYVNSWISPDVLNDQSQWELIWKRPTFLDKQSIFYAHKQQNVIVGCGGYWPCAVSVAGDADANNILSNLCQAPSLEVRKHPRRVRCDKNSFPEVDFATVDDDFELPF